MSTLLKIAFGVFCGLLSAGILFLVSGEPRGEPITLEPPPTAAPIAVYVTGEVRNPGVFILSPGSRVQDAILAAGDFLDTAEYQNINLAAYLEDSSHIHIPAISAIVPTVTFSTPFSGGVRSSFVGIKININTASQQELESLPSIGPEYAHRIIAFREVYGPFETIEAIQKVYGIGPATYENIKDLITVESSP